MIRIEHRGFRLQKIDRRNDTRLFSDKRDWIAIYRKDNALGLAPVEANGHGFTPEDAARAACSWIDLYHTPVSKGLPVELQSHDRFQVPSKLATEPYEEYLCRVLQGFEEWANRIGEGR